MELEAAFYIFAIVFMSIVLILLVALTVAVLVIRSKILAIERQVEAKIERISTVVAKGRTVLRILSRTKNAVRSQR